MRIFRTLRKESGYSLIEMTLAMTVVALMLGYGMRWQAIQQQRERGERDADYLAQFQYFVGSYFHQNRAGLIAAIKDGTGAEPSDRRYCIVGATGYNETDETFTGGEIARSESLLTCAIDEIFLNYKGLWIGRVATPEDDRYVAIFKLRDTDVQDVECLIVKMSADGTLSNSKADIDRLMALQKKLGARGGMVPIGTIGPYSGTKTAPTASGATWTVDLADFIDSDKLDIVKTVLPD